MNDKTVQTVQIRTKTVQEELRTKRLSETLPQGINLGRHKGDRPKPFFVRIGSGDDRKTASFASEMERNDHAQALAEGRQTPQALSAEAFESGEWKQFKLETGATMPEVREAWDKWKSMKNFTLLVGEATEKFKELIAAEGCSPDHFRTARCILGRFALAYGHLSLVSITPDHVRDWMARLGKEQKMAPATLCHQRKLVSLLYARAIREGWAPTNPCDAVVPPKVIQVEDIAVLNLENAFKFFKANAENRIIGKLALEAFAGLRCASVHKIDPKEVNLEEGAILLPAAKIKTNRRFYVEGMPGNVFAWVKDAPVEGWTIKKSNYNRLKAHAFLGAQVENPGNVLRHSFATFHLSAFQDPAKTALLMTHNVAMLQRHYRGRGVSKAEGQAYFQITPETVKLSWEEFQLSTKTK